MIILSLVVSALYLYLYFHSYLFRSTPCFWPADRTVLCPLRFRLFLSFCGHYFDFSCGYYYYFALDTATTLTTLTSGVATSTTLTIRVVNILLQIVCLRCGHYFDQFGCRRYRWTPFTIDHHSCHVFHPFFNF